MNIQIYGTLGGEADPTQLAAAYDACEDKGATIPEEKTLANLADCIETIPGQIVIPPEAGTLTSIVVGTLPDKTTYIEGDALDLTGLVILGNFSNGYQLDVTSGCTFTVNDPVTYYDTKIVVSYAKDEVTKTLDIPITVNSKPVLAPAETKGLWHFDDGTNKNEVDGKGTSTSGLVDPTIINWGIGKFGVAGQQGSSNIWFNYNNTLGLRRPETAHLSITDFTAEFWFKFDGNTSNYYIRTQFSNTPNASIELEIKTTSGASTITLSNPNNLVPGGTAQTIPFDTNWHHFAWVLNSGTAKVFIDGKMVTQSTSTSFNSGAGLSYIKINPTFSSAHVDEVLITENAKYVANFEPPHGPYYIEE